MKQFSLMLLSAIIMLSCNNPKDSNNPAIGTPIKVGGLEIAQNDLSEKMTGKDAKKICDELGDDWRLPTKEELNILYTNKDKIGGFVYGNYWSSTENTPNTMWVQNFGDGSGIDGAQDIPSFSVRVVRSPKN
jgi:hypothetical protein